MTRELGRGAGPSGAAAGSRRVLPGDLVHGMLWSPAGSFATSCCWRLSSSRLRVVSAQSVFSVIGGVPARQLHRGRFR